MDPLVAAFRCLDVLGRFAGQECKVAFVDKDVHPERGSGHVLAIRAVAGHNLGRVGFRLILDSAAMASAVDLHSSILNAERGAFGSRENALLERGIELSPGRPARQIA